MAQKKPSRAIKLFGTEILMPGGEARPHLTAVLDNGGLRYIRYRGVEVLRGIAYLVRDKNWGPMLRPSKPQGQAGARTVSR
jgi:hypothetical protein